MKQISKEEFRKMVTEIIPKAVAFSNFCQKFKMEHWQSDKSNYCDIPENILDHLSMIAWRILNE